MARSGKVTVVGAGFYGSTTAQRLAEYDLFETVVLTDIVEGKPEGLALDLNQSRPIEGFETNTRRPDHRARRFRVRSDRRLGRRGDHGRPAAQAGHEPHGPDRDQRQDRPLGRRERRSPRAERGRHRRVEPARRDDRAHPARHRLRAEQGDRPGRHARHRTVQLLRRRGTRRPGRQRADPDARLARRHDGPGAVPMHGRRQAADRSHAGRQDRGARRPVRETAAPRWSRCSRPAPRTTRRRPRPPAWPAP